MRYPATLFCLLAFLSGCAPSRPSGILSETYIHRYGVELPPEEWDARGQDGQIMAMRKDGVLLRRSYEAGVPQGEWTETYPYREEIAKKSIYNRGTLQKEIFYSPLGVPRKEISYDASGEERLIVWDQQGKPQKQEVYQTGALLAGTYYDHSNTEEGGVKDGKGTQVNRSPEGALESIREIDRGAVVLERSFDAQGTLSALTPYHEGKIEGTRRTFGHGGEPLTVEQWQDGTQQGVSVVFERGEKISELPFIAGRVHGIEKRYRDGTTLVEEVTWVNGQKHGPRKVFFQGSVQTDWFFEGRPVPNEATFRVLCNQR